MYVAEMGEITPTEIPKINLKMNKVKNVFEKLEPSPKQKLVKTPNISGYLLPHRSANCPDIKHPKKNPINVEDPSKLCWFSVSFHSFSSTGIKKDSTKASAPSEMAIRA